MVDGNWQYYGQTCTACLIFECQNLVSRMAEAAVEALTAASPPKYFCHKCSISIDLSPELPELTCPKCESGFVEELTRDLQAEHSASENSSHGMFISGPNLPSLFTSLMMAPSGDDDDDEFDLESNEDSDVDEVETNPSDRLLTRSRRRHRHNRRLTGLPRHSLPWPAAASPDTRNLFPRFIEDLLRDLTGGGSGHPPTLLPFLPPMFHGDPRDYAWGADGLDNAITQLLNQWETPGSPPATKEDIDGLPEVTIAQEHIDSETQCSVCMEDFHLGDVVRSLPCLHLFHADCISPWLQLHSTCPICRKTLGTPGDDAEVSTDERGQRRESTDTTDSSDEDDDDDDDESSSDDDDDAGAVNSSSTAAADNSTNLPRSDNDEPPAESAADIPDLRPNWKLYPDSSVTRGQNDYCPRSRSSSSSEYDSL